MRSTIEKVGYNAMLEQLAEECCELGQAALKLSRVLRGENPTSKSEEDCREALVEEVADVELCIDYLRDVIDMHNVPLIKAHKNERAWRRILSRQTED